MSRSGYVTITDLGHHVFDVHIDPVWHGTVAVTIPLHGRSDAVLHRMGGVWLAEGTHPGQRTVWVHHLSWFTSLVNKVKAKVTGFLCLTFNKSELLKCVTEKFGSWVDGKFITWVESHLPKGCVDQLAEAGVTGTRGGPVGIVLSVLQAAFSGSCVGSAGEYYVVPTGPSSSTTLPGTTPGGTVPGSGPSGGSGPTGGSGPPSPPASPSGPSAPGVPETAGGVAHTWTDYSNAGGSQGPDIAAGQTVGIECKVQGFKVADGNPWWYRVASSPWNSQYYVSADAFYNNGATSGSLQGTPFVDPSVPDCTSGVIGGGGGGPVTSGTPETAGGVAHTWTNYANAGGSQGPNVGAGQTIGIACAIQGFQVADGNTWWYLIASSPWNSQYYVSADAFYNNGQTSGSLQGTPFVDPNVPVCGSPPPPPQTWSETVGGNANTWTNYTNAGGNQGPTIPAYTTVQIACAIQGFRVADGNTWWYLIASSPWNSQYYVSADAFYNNGQTSGSLQGTPFVDPAVAVC